MKTLATLWVVAIVCLFDVGSAEEDVEGREVIKRLTKELEDQALVGSEEIDRLMLQAFAKLDAAADQAEREDSEVRCFEKAQVLLSQMGNEYFKELNECTVQRLTEALSWISKGNLSRKNVDSYISGELEKADACNKRPADTLLRHIESARPPANWDCSPEI